MDNNWNADKLKAASGEHHLYYVPFRSSLRSHTYIDSSEYEPGTVFNINHLITSHTRTFPLRWRNRGWRRGWCDSYRSHRCRNPLFTTEKRSPGGLAGPRIDRYEPYEDRDGMGRTCCGVNRDFAALAVEV